MLIKKIDLINILTDTLDYLEYELPNGPSNHSKRTTIIALYIAKALKLDEKELNSLCIYSLIHDCATSNEEFTLIEKQGRDQIEETMTHCLVINEIVPNSILRAVYDNVILYHHEKWDGSGLFKKRGNEIPLLSQIIKLANDIEILYRTKENPNNIFKLINDKCDFYYSSKIVEAFNIAQKNPHFYNSLKNSHLDKELINIIGNRELDIDSSTFYDLTNILKAILNTKSPFTYEHSSRVATLASSMADYYNFDNQKKEEFIFAAIFHDVGKLLVPNSIINKKGPLTKEEFMIIKEHPLHTNKLLKKVPVFKNICKWASQHHEKLNGSGYPQGLVENQLCFESQLLSVIDIYEALSSDRPYRGALSEEKLAHIMYEMSNKGELNKFIVKDVLEVFNQKKEA